MVCGKKKETSDIAYIGEIWRRKKKMVRILSMVIFILFVVGVAFKFIEKLYKKIWEKRNQRSVESQKKNTNSSNENVKTSIGGEEGRLIAQWKAIYEEKGELEQKMAMLVGGDTGMSILRMRIQRVKDKGGQQMYKESYLRKREKLEELNKQYTELMKKAKKLPEIRGYYFEPIQDIAFYRELLDYRP